MRPKAGSPGHGSSIAVDPALGRAFLLVGGGIDVYDLNTFKRLGTVPVSGIELGHPFDSHPHLVPWGADGLALLDIDEIFLIQSPLFGS